MQLILFRHAHKGLMPAADPELSAPGFKQAEKLVDLVSQNKIPAPTKSWVSEKIRTRQTLEPVNRKFQASIEVSDLLNLRAYSENADQFRLRIKKMLAMIDNLAQKNSNEIHYLCTHYDWIEEALVFIQSTTDLTTFEFASWAPAQYLHFEISDGIWIVKSKGVCPL